MQTKKIGAFAMDGTALGTVVGPGLAPVAAAGAQPLSVSSIAQTDPPRCEAPTPVGTYPNCISSTDLVLLSLAAGILQGIANLAAP